MSQNTSDHQIIKHALIYDKLCKDFAWCCMVTTLDELNALKQAFRELRGKKMIKQEGFFGLNKMGMFEWASCEGLIYAAQVKFIQQGATLLIWHANGGYVPLFKPLTPSDNFEIKSIQYLPFPQMPTDKKSDIVVCENDPVAEDWWIELLRKKYPDYSICVLTRFSERDHKDIASHFEAAKIISFTTSFSSYEWFDKLIDCLESSKLRDKIIFGNNYGQDWIENLPVALKAKLSLQQANNNLTIEQRISNQQQAISARLL